MTPDQAMKTPISRIYGALEGHMEYLTKTSPFHGGPMVDDKPKETVAEKAKRIFGGRK